MKKLPEHIQKAIDGYVPQMHGWVTPERCAEMAAAVLEVKAPTAVSIGVFAGRSLLSMAFAMRELGKGMVFGLDPWRLEAAMEGEGDAGDKNWWKDQASLELMHRLTMTNIWAHRLEPWCSVIRTESQHVAHIFHDIGVLEIDGNHTEIASCRDVELYAPGVIKGGYIFADDSDWQTTQKAMRMLDECCELVNDTGKARTYRKK